MRILSVPLTDELTRFVVEQADNDFEGKKAAFVRSLVRKARAERKIFRPRTKTGGK